MPSTSFTDRNLHYLDDLFLLFSLKRSWGHKQLLWRNYLQLRGRARKGICTGLPLMKWRFDVLRPENAHFLFTEIFMAEPYFFETTRPAPFIVDGGVNVGFSIAYFKWLYPDSRIVGFEPFPAAYDVAKRNIDRNQLSDVKLIQAALCAREGTASLNYIADDMSSTLSSRLTVRGAQPKVTAVESVRLSQYIEGEVDFLKLDIEGTEQEVLCEIEPKLRQVRNMFIEFHCTQGDAANSLPRTLDVLERNGFTYLITSPIHFRRVAAVMPLNVCGPISSLSLFARRNE
jgi:FkbM family methyltransferase